MLRLRRKVTYTFIVEAGNDPNDGPNYHPFYITDSESWWHFDLMLSQLVIIQQAKNEQVFAGYDPVTKQATAGKTI